MWGIKLVLSVSLTDPNRIEKLLGSQEQVILAIDGLQPQVGHEVLWVIRDCISESILLARSLLSSRGEAIRHFSIRRNIVK